ncbi:heparin lyase I family protein [Romeria aff. gracilis LEGE 07310]|uniref:Heparin lyase I family protein n=1 Tax=Vasconcelosia minhoensis LEGE 07310 TaxID=915328 RepID=A0A8J7DL10_9CYAN|nr:heparin lyase I family protein [Romeria gracilis]MBE9076881.1 heparin lyase I family protein [Romeria aff. gracilis LEGE 07310]
MESLETLHPEPIFTNGQSASLEPFPSTQSQLPLGGNGQSAGDMMLNAPIMPEPVALVAESNIVASPRSISGSDALTGRSAGSTRDELLNNGLVYYENFEGQFQNKKASEFFLQSGPSNNRNSGFRKVDATELNNSYAIADLQSGSAAYGNGSLAMTLKRENSRMELGQANKFNQSHFSGEGDNLWVGASIKIDPSYTEGSASTRIIQLKRNYRPGKVLPVGRPPFSVFYDAKSGNLKGVINREYDGAGKEFSLGKVKKGEWYDFVIHTYWSSTNKGHTELWLNGQKKVDYRGANVSSYMASEKNSYTTVQIGVYNSRGVDIDSKLHLDEVRLAANEGYYDIVKPGGMLTKGSSPKPVEPAAPVNPPVAQKPQPAPSQSSSPPKSNASAGNTLRVEAESNLVNLDKGGKYDGIFRAGDASGDKAYAMKHDGAAATFKFTGESGSYSLNLNAKADLYKGAPRVTVSHNNGSQTWSTEISSTSYQLQALNGPNLNLKKGDTVTLKFDNDLYEGSVDKDRNLYLDYLEFVPAARKSQPPVQSVPSAPSVPSVLPPAYSTVQVQAESSLVALNDLAQKGRVVSAKDASGGKALALFHGKSAATFTFTGESGRYGLSLNAKADLYKGAPAVTVSQNDSKQTWTTPISSTSYKLHELNVPSLNLKKGDTVTLNFDDDLYGGSGKDRNLYLDYLAFVPQVK